MMIGNDSSPGLDGDDRGGHSSEEVAGDYRLLHEIKAMSRALCRPLPIPRRTSASSSIRTPSSQKSTVLWKGSVLEPRSGEDDEGIAACKLRKSGSSWSWKKPLKALSRIRDRLPQGGIVPGREPTVMILSEGLGAGSLQSVHSLALLNPPLELSKSIGFFYRKLDEDESRTRSQCLMENVDQDPVKARGDSCLDTVEMTGENATDELEYVVIDRGIEVADKEKLDSVQDDAHSRDGPNADDDALRVLGLGHEEEIRRNIDEGTSLNPVDSNFCARKGKDSKECHEEIRTKYKTSRICKKSTSLDSARADKETGACFLAMHGTRQDSSCGSLDRDPESPRERLLREFKEEALASGNFIIGFDSDEEEEEEE